jgi:serine/threonine-protein kinase
VIRGGSGKIRPVFFITPMIGTKLAHYEITSHLGSGGMGEVYQAMDSKLGRSVAVKFLSEAFARDADRLIRFEREARVLASLNHPNIAGIYGLEESGGRRFLVMELIPGETLAERIQRGPIPVRGEFPPRPQLVFDIARDNASAIDTISDRRSWIRFGTETRTC